MRTRFLRVDGCGICYLTAGDSGPAVLCIQGVGVAGQGWLPQIEVLSKQFQVVAFDNRGIGRSSASATPLTIETMAEDALAIADELGHERFHLVGHSMGGVIAQEVALRAPGRIASLSLLCTAANGRDLARLSPAMLLKGIRARLGTRAMRRSGMMRLILPDAWLATVNQERLAAKLQSLFGRDLADQPPVVMEQLRAMSRYSAVDRLAALPRVPTLVVSGSEDAIARPELGRRLAAGIDGARFIELAGAGHALTIQCADTVNALLLEHLASIQGQAGV